MPVLRKPPPSLESIEEGSIGASSRASMPNEEISRFTLSDDQVKPSSSYGELAYDQIDEAVTLMQQRFPDDASPSRPPLPIPPSDPVPPPSSSSNVDFTLPPHMPYRDSYASSQQTVYDQDIYYGQEAATRQELEGEGLAYHHPSVPVPPQLPTIDSGQPMQWDLGDGHDASDPFLDNPPHMYNEPNPFHDHAAPMPSLPSDGMTPMDSFQFDPERYGSYGRGSYLPPTMSRSPTPGQSNEYYMVDEKDASGYIEQQEPFEHDIPGDPEKMIVPEDPPMDTKHFGPAPTGRILRRHKTKKRVPLTEGNLVTHIDVPTQLVLPRKGEPEMMQTR